MVSVHLKLNKFKIINYFPSKIYSIEYKEQLKLKLFKEYTDPEWWTKLRILANPTRDTLAFERTE